MEFKANHPLTHGFKTMDRILGCLFASLSDGEIFLTTNALSQKNTNLEKPWILYRQFDQASFLNTVGIQFSHVESHMTHDAHIYFANEKEAVEAKTILEGARIEGAPLFLVESYPDAPAKLFYRICFTDETSPDVHFSINQKSYRFRDLFQPIIQRTGKHIQEGTVYCSEDLFPACIKNHELLSRLYFGTSTPKENDVDGELTKV